METILNIMLGPLRGGLEQAAVDYAEALRLAGYRPLTVTTPGAWINALLAEKSLPYVSLRNFGGWDLLAAWRLERLAKCERARAAVCHGNRGLTLAHSTLEGVLPIIAVAHNYQTRHFHAADYCVAITHHAADKLAEEGIPPARIFTIANMVRLQEVAPRERFRTPPVVGSMGRFVAKKGFDVFLEALALLKSRGMAFSAVLAGEGEEEKSLNELVRDRGLADAITLPGWASDKGGFFAGIDLFVLPSKQEPFGIVVLEAMAYGVPVIAADAEGPREIVHHGADGLLVPRGDAAALADAIATLLTDAAFARKLALTARAMVERDYGPEGMAACLKSALSTILPAASPVTT